jgi:hypothetical protein
VFSVKAANSFLIWSVLCSCFRSLLLFGSGKGGGLDFLVWPLVLCLLCLGFGGNRSS